MSEIKSWDMWAMVQAGYIFVTSPQPHGKDDWFRVRVVAWDPKWPAQSEVPHRGERVRSEGKCDRIVATGIPLYKTCLELYDPKSNTRFAHSLGLVERIPPEADERRELASWINTFMGVIDPLPKAKDKLRRIAELLEQTDE